jgi:hypothetical protein
MPIPRFPGLPVLSAGPESRQSPLGPGSSIGGPEFPQGSFVIGSGIPGPSGTAGVSGSDFSFTTEGESSGTRRTGKTERSGESKRSRDYKGKGKAKIQQLEADLKAEREKTRRLMAMFIARTDKISLEEAYEELDRQEAMMEEQEKELSKKRTNDLSGLLMFACEPHCKVNRVQVWQVHR